MKKTLLLSLFAIIPFLSIAQTQLKFATVKLQEIFQSMPETIEANKTLEELAQKYEEENKKLKIEYENKYTDYVRSRNGMPQNIRARREQELLLISQSIADFRMVAQKDIEQQQELLMLPIKAKLMDAVKSVGAEGGYAFVIDEAQMLYMGVDFEDITIFVKAKLDIL
ncbi:MAG: OmpH family outer membrane protein [Bacteroidales bacterium]|nr:OmpH family outer membrane protein [Bacteroidales bacterium]MBR5532733.1 OmpH family outer membrane protein [Bacteroidales bacterium]